MSKVFTVCAAFYDQDSRATVRVEADSFEAACERACELIDSGEVSTDQRSWDPTATFVMGVVEGDGDPFNGSANVPAGFTDPMDRTALERAAPDMLAALRGLHEWLCNVVDSSRLDDDDRAKLAAADSAIAKAEGKL